MPGQPQLREHAWLYLPGDDLPAASVRVEQRMDGSGMWVVLHNLPAEAPTVRSEHPNRDTALAEAQRIRDRIDSLYRQQHGITGHWAIHTRDTY
jgi:hypothetical protein